MICTIKQYITTASTTIDKINAIDTLISSMLGAVASNISFAGVKSYKVEDGQMTINTECRSIDELISSVDNLEKLKSIYMNSLNGSITVLRGKSMF